MQSLSEFYQRYLEHELVKDGHAIDFYRTACWAWRPSPVLLFELKHYAVAALRVPLAVTWLTVYRQLHIPVKDPRPSRPFGKQLGGCDL